MLEKIQQDASGGGLNRTIKDSYFASACSKPSTVFPKLYKLSQNHIKKLSSPIFYNKLCGEILDGLDGKFPSTLSLDDQGRFIVGYAQQYRDLYTKSQKISQKKILKLNLKQNQKNKERTKYYGKRNQEQI